MIELGEAEAAVAVIQRGIVVGQGESFGRSAMIHCLITLGRVEEARALAQAYLAEYPSHTVGRARQELRMYESRYRDRRLVSHRTAGIPE